MLIISDGSYSAINPAFPLIPIPFNKIKSSEFNRLLRIVPFFIGLECVMLLIIIFYFLTDSPLSFGPALISVGLAAMILLRVLFRKIVILDKEKIRIVDIAPKSIWIDHFLLCITFGFGFLLNAKIAHVDLIGTNFYSVFAWLCFFVAALPVLNLIVCKQSKWLGSNWNQTGQVRIKSETD